MTQLCLICDTKAVLSKEAVDEAVVLIGIIDGFLLDVRQVDIQGLEMAPGTRPGSLLVQLLDLIGGSVSSATSGYIALTAFAKAMQKYQFDHYDRLCFRCGAKFYSSPPKQHSLSPLTNQASNT